MPGGETRSAGGGRAEDGARARVEREAPDAVRPCRPERALGARSRAARDAHPRVGAWCAALADDALEHGARPLVRAVNVTEPLPTTAGDATARAGSASTPTYGTQIEIHVPTGRRRSAPETVSLSETSIAPCGCELGCAKHRRRSPPTSR